MKYTRLWSAIGIFIIGALTVTAVWADHHGSGGVVNINTADASTLQTLPNIGPAKADDILKYRQQHGPFKTIEDLKKVKGIGDKTFEKLKQHITVSQSTSLQSPPTQAQQVALANG